MAPVVPIVGAPILRFQDIAQYIAVAAGGEVHKRTILFLFYILVLKHLTINEEAIIWNSKAESLYSLLAERHIPEIIFLRSRVHRVGLKAYVLGCVISETSDSTGNELIYIRHVIVLKIRIFRINIRQPSHLSCRTLEAVVVILDFIETIGVVKLLMSADRFIECILYSGVVY